MAVWLLALLCKNGWACQVQFCLSRFTTFEAASFLSNLAVLLVDAPIFWTPLAKQAGHRSSLCGKNRPVIIIFTFSVTIPFEGDANGDYFLVTLFLL